jgi:hypothetical protein
MTKMFGFDKTHSPKIRWQDLLTTMLSEDLSEQPNNCLDLLFN